ncbi:MAG: hypothetical protein EGQ81_02345, partial [Akkermansia sp.]|nr:hypothetical protein [Akkermansia sp.]
MNVRLHKKITSCNYNCPSIAMIGYTPFPPKANWIIMIQNSPVSDNGKLYFLHPFHLSSLWMENNIFPQRERKKIHLESLTSRILTWHFAAENGEAVRVPGFPTRVIDTIGSGDAHAGGILAGLMSGFTLPEAVL